MKLSKDLIAKSSIAIGTFAALATKVFAYDYTYSYDLGTASGDAAAGGVMAFIAANAIIVLCACLFGLLFLAFNIWMLVDLTKRTEAELPNKQTWLILMIAGLVFGFGWIVAAVYFFGPRKKFAHKK